MEKPLLDVVELKTYFYTLSGVAKAVDGVSFHLDPGEKLGIVGESGCGKSVTARSILRIVPSPPGRIVSGQVHFKDEDLINLSENKMNKIRGSKISMIYQEPMSAMNPAFTIGNQIGEVFRFHHGKTKKEAVNDVIKIMEKVGIPAPEKRVNDYPHQLSGGMLQRVVIAMAIASHPEILIADEPTTALDVTIQAQILQIIKELTSDIGMALILITHDLGVVANTVDRVIVMYSGVIVETAKVRDIFKNPSHPYTQGLFKCIPRIGGEQTVLDEISGVVPNLLNLPDGCLFAVRCPFAKENCHKKRPDLIEVAPEHYSRCLLHSNGVK